jgi:thymidylate synthase (FAD)
MDNFDCYISPTVAGDPELKDIYEQFEVSTREWYQAIRCEMELRGISGEQANDLMRTLLPIGVPTKLRIGFDIEALIHFMHKRLCLRADQPIRQVATLMRKEVLSVEPRYAEFLVPQCQSLMYCPEKHGGCGAYPSKEELKKILRER